MLTDFATGAEGDVLDIVDYLAATLSDWDGDNPFGASGHLRLLQAGTATLLQIDRDGAAGTTAAFTTLVTLQNTDAAQFTVENFNGYAPDGSPVVGKTITGTSGVDNLVGTVGDDIINGLAVASVFTSVSMAIVAERSTATNGEDVVVPSFSGTYSITQSPAGSYRFDLGTVSLLDDALIEGEETISIRVTASGQVFESGTDSIVVTVRLRSDDPAGTEGADTLTGTGTDDVLLGLGGNDTLYGEGGGDRLVGGRGNNTLFGGAGADGFVFDPLARGERDMVRDFGAADRFLSTVRLADSNRDGMIDFGGDRALDLGDGEIRVFSEANRVVDRLFYRGETEIDGVTYFSYSLFAS